MTHPPAWGSCDSSNEGNNWLPVLSGVVLYQVFSCLLFSLTTNLTDHDDTRGLGVVEEDLKTVNEVGSIERISPNANTKSLAQTHSTGLVHSLVCESARPADHPYAPLLVDVPGHDTNLASSRGNNSGTVGAYEARLALPQEGVLHLDHVLLGDTCVVRIVKKNYNNWSDKETHRTRP